MILNRCREFKKADGVRDGDAAFADFRGGLFLGELKLVDELRVTEGFFERIEVLALEILDQGEFQHRAVIGFAQDHRDFGNPGELCRAPAAFSGDQLEGVAFLADDERLDDALFADGIRQFAQRFFGEIFSRLQRAGLDALKSDAKDFFAVVHGCLLASGTGGGRG